MKTTVFSMATMATFLLACNNENNNTAKEGDKPADTTSTNVQPSNDAATPGATNDMLTSYLQLKNALVADNSNEAATAGNQLKAATQKIDVASLTDEQNKMYEEVKEEIIDHADHIGSNGGNIVHQREHFDMISVDMYDLVKAVKPNQTLYKTHCPMFNNKKGAIWLSETKEIKNPYYGKEMLTCGVVKEEIK